MAKKKAKKADAAKKETTDAADSKAYTKAEHQHYDAIRMKERTVRGLQHILDNAKCEASIAKKAFDKAGADLRDLIRENPKQQKLPGFPPEDKPDPESWKLVPIAVLVGHHGLSKSIAEKLLANDPPLKTLGQVADWRNYDGNRLTNIKGLGEKAADKYSDALQAWLKKHPDQCPKDEEKKK